MADSGKRQDPLPVFCFKVTLGIKGGKEGEILFLGGGGGQRPDTKWEVTFKFAGSPNVTSLTIGDISGVDKKGWEYLWPYLAAESKTIGPDNVQIQSPKYALVEQLYQEQDLSQLGIGTTLPNTPTNITIPD